MGDHVPGFNMRHVPHKMAELAFNISHRYSDNLSKAQIEEYRYFLSFLHQNKTTHNDMNDSKLCTALIPSTMSWININCTRQLVDVTFLCQYTSDSAYAQFADEICEDINNDYYCETGWVWGYKTVLN